MYDLTDEERDFLRDHRGGLFGILLNHSGPKGEANQIAADAVATIETKIPSRTERLLVFGALAAKLQQSRNDLVREILRTNDHWVRRDDGRWCGLAWQVHEIDALASLSGLSVSTLNRWEREISRSTLEAARARYDVSLDEEGREEVGAEDG